MEEIILQKSKRLLEYGIPSNSVPNLIAGGLYFNEMKGIPLVNYWNESKPNLRDELFFLTNTMFGLADLSRKVNAKNEWLISFEVAYLMFMKVFSQNIVSIDKLAQTSCYIDALVICRTILSKINLLTIFSLEPTLHDEWLKKSEHRKFNDGIIRQELRNHNLPNFHMTYKYLSGLIHGQFEASSNTGSMEPGLFPKIKLLENKIYIVSKILIAMSCYSLLSLFLIDQDNEINNDIIEYDNLFNYFFDRILAFNRIEHLFLMNDDMLLVNNGGEQYSFSNPFDFKNYRAILNLFYKKDDSKKILSKIYTDV